MTTFAEAMKRQRPLLLPAAHDALTARLIEATGRFPAYQIGGFALDASAEAIPDIGLRGFGDQFPVVQRIVAASSLPVLVDADTGGDVKMMRRIVTKYEDIGVSAMFIEDQKPPKKCGHMEGKKLISIRDMVGKLRSAISARKSADFLIFARTDAIEPEGVEGAIRRASWYADVADGVYVEGIRSEEEAEQIGWALNGCPLATSVLEGGGKTPFLSPERWRTLGFAMILFPTTVLFQTAAATNSALVRLSHGQPMPEAEAMTREQMEELLLLPQWRTIEETFVREEAG